MPVPGVTLEPSEQQRRVRRSALLLALIAAAFYVGYIVLTLLRSAK
jgi:hypothetical protein